MDLWCLCDLLYTYSISVSSKITQHINHHLASYNMEPFRIQQFKTQNTHVSGLLWMVCITVLRRNTTYTTQQYMMQHLTSDLYQLKAFTQQNRLIILLVQLVSRISCQASSYIQAAAFSIQIVLHLTDMLVLLEEQTHLGWPSGTVWETDAVGLACWNCLTDMSSDWPAEIAWRHKDCTSIWLDLPAGTAWRTDAGCTSVGPATGATWSGRCAVVPAQKIPQFWSEKQTGLFTVSVLKHHSMCLETMYKYWLENI